jgi:dGTPase
MEINNKIHEFGILKANQQFARRIYDKETIDSFRNQFGRDRDRVFYSKEFRRLEGKTQVFVNGFDDHLRNRLTHTQFTRFAA